MEQLSLLQKSSDCVTETELSDMALVAIMELRKKPKVE